MTNLLSTVDPVVAQCIQNEHQRQRKKIQLTASENIASHAVMEAVGSVLTNKYAEGYPSKRYYNGCEHVDEIETLAIERACKLFNCDYANVQPHSGSQANQAVFLALLKPGDTILGLSLDSGGHLTHGSPVNLSGKWFHSIQYPVDKESYIIDMNVVEQLALQYKPKMIIAGASAYPGMIDFAAFRTIANKIGAFFLADIAHYAGLIATKDYPSPLPHADIVTSTTHKTLRGPRGGLILSNNEGLMKKVNSAIFPGLQGGPMMNIIAGKAIAFYEALQPSFSIYIKQVLKNARQLVKTFVKNEIQVITKNTHSHIVLLDLSPKKLKGRDVANTLDTIGIVCNKNAIPFDIKSPFSTSGIRLGSPFETSRGLGSYEFERIAQLITRVVHDNISIPEAQNEVTDILSKT